MKKLVAFAAGIMLSAVAFAEGITVGGRGLLGANIGTTCEGDFENDSLELMSPIGITAFVKIPLPVLDGKLAVQPELGLSRTAIGYKYEETVPPVETEYYYESGYTISYSGNASYWSLDIPVLVTYDFNINDKLTISPELGPKISIPLGDLDMDIGDGSIDSHILFGIDFGAGLSYKVGPGAIYGDLRYDLGLTKLKVEDEDFATPRALIFSIGYGITF